MQYQFVERINQFFDFSAAQLRFISILAIAAVVLSAYAFIRSYSTPTLQTPDLPVFLADEEKFVGLFVLDPNTAPADSLELLPGVGRTLADRIVAYRQVKPFKSEIDITEVKGIGPKLYERLKPYLRVQK
ncbi:MAG: helix-hairpin-helix domain-containing protein [Candidatus Zixiibacteriota bacterium]